MATAALGQQPTKPPAGTISGSVIDAGTGAPIDGATVAVSVAGGFGVLSAQRSGASALALANTATTPASGVYRFAELPAGAYQLRIQRLGYAPATITVELGEAGASRVSVGLVVAPVRLRAIEVRARGPRAGPDDAAAGALDERISLARARQHEFLSTDTRELTTEDLAESATLGGRDVLRALQRLPGVTQFDDWSAKVWVRGNRWDHNRVYYDGLPLFEPLGALGRDAGVSADAIGGAMLHPGVRPVSVGGEGATQIDLRSRAASGAGEWRGSAEVTRFGFGGALERRREDQSAGFTLSAHHTLGDFLPAIGGDRSANDAQVAMHADAQLSDAAWLETSALVTRDAHQFGDARGPIATFQDWGNAAARVTLGAQLGSISTSHTLGISHFGSSSARSLASSSSTTVTSDPLRSQVDYVTLGGRASTPQSHVSAGYDVVAQRSSFAGPRLGIFWGDLSFDHVARDDALLYGSAWASRRDDIGDRVTIESGARLDAGGSAHLDAVRPAGSAQVRVAVTQNTSVSAGVSRTHQYVQSIDLPAASQGPTNPPLWLTSGGDVPAMSIDNAMAGAERWISASTLVAVNAYWRRTLGAIVADPAPGPLVVRPLFVGATESARGIELSARKLAGRSTGLVAYSYGTATTTAAGLSFPSSADRTHALDLAWAIRFGGLRATTAFALTSGAPYTRTLLTNTVFTRGAPNAQRLPDYQSLDLFVDYTWVIGRTSVTGFAGVQNATGRRNLTWYEYSGDCRAQTNLSEDVRCVDGNVIGTPVRATRMAGLRVVY